MKLHQIALSSALTAIVGFATAPAVGAFLDSVTYEGGVTRSGEALPPKAEENRSPKAVIPSNAPDALKVPETWTCDYLLPDYQAWLDEGNDPRSWPMVDKTYRDVKSGKKYYWVDWIDWINDNHCVATGLIRPEALPVAGSILGPLLGGVGAAGAVAGAAAGSGSPDSPG